MTKKKGRSPDIPNKEIRDFVSKRLVEVMKDQYGLEDVPRLASDVAKLGGNASARHIYRIIHNGEGCGLDRLAWIIGALGMSMGDFFAPKIHGANVKARNKFIINYIHSLIEDDEGMRKALEQLTQNGKLKQFIRMFEIEHTARVE